MTRVFLHLHVPKNAGNSFNYVLRSCFGKSFYPYYGLMDIHRFNAADLKLLISSHPQFRAYASHMVSLDLPEDSKDNQLSVIAFVRPPGDWLFSFYCYQKNNTGFQFDKGLTYPQFLDKHLGQESSRYVNGQLNFLTRGCNSSDGLCLVQQELASRRLLLFPTTEFDRSMVVLERAFPNEMKDCSYPCVANTSSKRGECAESTYDLNSACKQDAQLFDLSLACLKDYESRVAGDKDECSKLMKGFSRRCRKKARKEAIRKLARRIARR